MRRYVLWSLVPSLGLLAAASMPATRPTPLNSGVAIGVPPQDAPHWLAKVGIGPRSLAAAGVDSQQVGPLATAAGEFLEEHGASLQQAELTHWIAASAVRSLEVAAVRGGLGADETPALEDARDHAAASEQSLGQQLDALFTAATGSLTQPQRDLLATLRANRRVELPLPYLAAQRTDAQWQDLRVALAAEWHSQAIGQPLDPAIQQYLGAVRSEASVSLAIANISANELAVRVAWELVWPD